MGYLLEIKKQCRFPIALFAIKMKNFFFLLVLDSCLNLNASKQTAKTEHTRKEKERKLTKNYIQVTRIIKGNNNNKKKRRSLPHKSKYIVIQGCINTGYDNNLQCGQETFEKVSLYSMRKIKARGKK